MDLFFLISYYRTLLDDRDILVDLREKSKGDEVCKSITKLIQHNSGYISQVEGHLRNNVPDNLSAFDTLTDSNVADWFEFWVTHLHFCEGREEKLIRLFSEMVDVDFEKWKTYQDSIKTICMCESMSYFATMTLPCQADIVEALLFVVDKCATRNEAEFFYNEINVARMLA